MKPSDMNQFEWHKKPNGWKVCPQCGCENIRAGTLHRATTADEGWTMRALWIKRITACFGTTITTEAISPA